jgi:arylsulfatase A-like enzyme
MNGFYDMNGSTFSKMIIFSVTGMLVTGSPCFSMPLESNGVRGKPNIILIMADDMGFSDLGCYGSEIDTPNLDRLADKGLRFTHFYNNAKCGPSRASLVTGLYPQQSEHDRMKNSVNIAQVLKAAGYRTLMTGKNHGGLTGLPTEQGFDRYYGLNSGCCNFFNPGLKRPGENEPGRKSPDEQRPWVIDHKVMQPYTPEDKSFYATDAFSDSAIGYLEEYGKESDPFFLYVSYTAPHFPLHAKPEDIAKYRGKYKIGWDVIRQQRYERLIELGLIDKRWKLPTRDIHVPKWNDVEDKDSHDLEMAVYAAMIDCMDQGIGRIMAKVRQLGIEDNTLVLFLSDNGSCAEDYRIFDSTAKEIPPGPMESYRTLGVSWAHTSNTPFRKYKWWNNEGGISTPLIAYWPRVIKDGGKVTHQVGHIMDIMATCLDIAGAPYPSSYQGKRILPLKGKSLLPIFQARQRQGHDVLYWQFGSSCVIRKRNWKLVCDYAHPKAGIDYFDEDSFQPKREPNGDMQWELYNMRTDRTETNDLAEKYPEIVKQMAQAWDQWKNK